MSTTLPSWSGLSRPSMSSFGEGCVQDVDARHKGEHDYDKNASPSQSLREPGLQTARHERVARPVVEDILVALVLEGPVQQKRA